MDPITAIVLVGTMVAGGMQAYGAYQQGQYQEDMAEYNAEVAKQKSRRNIEQAAEERQRIREKGERMTAEQRSLLGASGVDLASGSAAEMLAETAAGMEYDMEQASYKGLTRSTRASNQAQLDLIKGRTAAKRGTNRAVGHVLDTGTSLMSTKWKK